MVSKNSDQNQSLGEIYSGKGNDSLLSEAPNEAKKRKKLNTKILRKWKFQSKGERLQMLTCYDYQTAQLLEEIGTDLLLVGDSLANVVLGYETTIPVGLDEMLIFAKAVKRGAKNSFVIFDMPFGTYSSFSKGLENASIAFKESGVEAIKLEGASEFKLKLIRRLTEIGIPVMGHIGVTPQSVHEQGGYYIQGKSEEEAENLLKASKDLEEAGVFSLVLECVEESVAKKITKLVSVPTIGIGSGLGVDGEVLVINDLLKLGKNSPPKFCTPIIDLYQTKKECLTRYLKERRELP